MPNTKSVFLETHNINNRATGLGTFNYELIKGLHRLDFENLELHLNSGKPKLLKSEFGEVFKYHKYMSFHRYKTFRPVHKFDLWHSVNQNSKLEPRFAAKYLLTVHDVNFVEEISSDMSHKRNQLFMEKLKKATAITYISEFAKKQTHDYFKVPDVPEYVIYNGNPISTLLDTSGFVSTVPVDKPFFYTIGDFIERKNYASIINMMRLLKDFNLIISGNNTKKYGQVIKSLIEEKGLSNQVFLTGKVSDEGKQYYMKNCTAFLFPSIREGFGLPPIEAMSFGKPVFLSDKTSLPEIGGEMANYWTDFDPEYMKNVLLDGLHNFENNKAVIETEMKKRAASFDWKIAAADYLKIYKDILK
ncbi:glycosyltransferase family 4 protein [Flavobacterium sp. 1355]|jgi:glycosyltransferase involved in cell wall biosynthesis|uniref:glycosyltransferase family 4 protein n=1 Tax=Flavobacterium sp. 1355 TaxID=2806571 RepID=UPI001AE5EB6B|nr:glycosyltransferase family 1 protein [Flavobacterium sp. 1355]MBP1224924.1 glycosyltransferase involved in cell wall biosynthesis [Flavobacterium sp. 1355]